MDAGLPDLAVCLGCGYSLRHLTKPRCPECGRPFDPKDQKTFCLPSGRKGRMPIKLGLALSVLHLGTTLGLVVFSLSVGMANFYAPNPATTPFADAAGFIAIKALMQPIMSLWGRWMSQNVPNPVEWVFFLLNSALWGFGAAFLVRWIRNPSKA